jgi:hypothetical protein
MIQGRATVKEDSFPVRNDWTIGQLRKVTQLSRRQQSSEMPLRACHEIILEERPQFARLTARASPRRCHFERSSSTELTDCDIHPVKSFRGGIPAVAGGAMANPHAESQGDAAVDLYKTEYQLAAARYENIYAAIWQNFSYMSAISGAVLAFGGDRLQPHFLWFIVCLPLVFWYWATFEPLDRYGETTATHLSDIERRLNNRCGTSLGHFLQFGARIATNNLSHWERFSKDIKRVRYRVLPVFWIFTLICVIQFGLSVKDVIEGHSLMREAKAETKIVTVSLDELQKLQTPKVVIPVAQPPAPAEQTPDKKN